MPIAKGTNVPVKKNTYKTVELPLLAKTTRKAYQSHIDRYILPKFGEMSMPGYDTRCPAGIFLWTCRQ